ncbi:sulfotransferase family protein [Mycolicibacterium fortuitum]|uniref:sulfotransferase family protein n=1 Tax=Mycolicibacterium fortuitum TaxID=1766 RepID=UPI001AF010C3|nr:sulfotransferase [Mycolicibacterium fortuitum]MBP3082637.1 sulfotransferase [Mycolicibacterium fortuitum]MCA4754289.1 sulfotransferase [Mycolicibacterium fortuitum]WAY20021.1 sulfotransferase [Mycolicibacterium fortuitum]
MSGWTAPARTPEALKAYAAAEADRAVRPDRYQLGADAVEIVIDRGTRREGAGVLGDADQWRPGLLHYLVSAEEDGRLNALGALTAQRTAAGRLAARAAISRYLHEHPDTEHRSLNPPIIITGGWRTGTTFLFRLLDRDPRVRAPLPAELGMPWRLPGALEADERVRRLEAAAAGPYMLHVLNPAMAAVHDSGPNLPEECVLGMGTTLRNWGFTATTRLDGYATWLAGQDFTAEYAQHRRMLQILDAGDGRRWVLKAPAHTAELRHVIATYPGACIVQLHRDIVETVASGASLFATYRSTYSDHVDGADVGRFQTEQTELWLRRAVAARASASTVTWLDLQYTDLVADPEATVRRIYAAAQMEPPDLAGMLAEQHRAQPRHGKGRHSYQPEQFGIDPDELRERMGFYTRALAGSETGCAQS